MSACPCLWRASCRYSGGSSRRLNVILIPRAWLGACSSPSDRRLLDSRAPYFFPPLGVALPRDCSSETPASISPSLKSRAAETKKRARTILWERTTPRDADTHRHDEE